MANTTFKLRRSSVAGKSPNTSTLSIGELAINLTDRKLYSSDGTNIFETGSNLTSLAVFSSIAIGNSTVNTTVNSTAFSGTSNAATYVIANSGITSNASGVFVTQGTGTVVNATGVHVNSAYINTISSNNSSYLGGLAASNYANTSAPLITTSVTVGNATVNATVNSTSFTGTASNATNLNSQPGSYYTNATNITTGTLPYAQIPANIINTTAAFTITGVHTHNANVVIGTTAGLSANGGYGTSGQVLTTNGAGVYWSTAAGGGGSVGGSNTQIQFNDSGSANGTAAITFDKTSNTFGLSNTSSLLIGNSTINTTANSISVIAQVGYLNQNSLSFGTYTTNASLNMMLVGPYTVSSGNTLIISTGTRTIIV